MMSFFKWIFQSWWASGVLQRLAPGLPAAIVCLAWLPFAYLILGWTPVHIKGHYIEVANAALNGTNYETARVAYERLIQLSPKDRDAYTFGLARSVLGLGRTNEALALLDRLMPLDGPGYLPARMYVARQLTSVTNPPPEALSMALTHLRMIKAFEPKNTEAIEQLAQLYLRINKWEDAKRELLELVGSRPDLSLSLSSVCASLNDDDGSRKWAERAASYFQTQVEVRPGSIEMRLKLCDSMLLLKRHADALSIAQEGLKRFGGPGWRLMVSRVCSVWLAALPDNKDTLGNRLELVQIGLVNNPMNEPLLRELIRLSHMEGSQGDAARSTLTGFLAEGKGTALLHVCLGLDAWERQKPELAREHFAVSFSLTPQMPTVANNMAMILIMSTPPDPDRALNIINAVLDKYPNAAIFHETRGQIFVKLGRWREALLDLEFALSNSKGGAGLHRAMAEACENLGMKELAAKHRDLATTNATTTVQ